MGDEDRGIMYQGVVLVRDPDALITDAVYIHPSDIKDRLGVRLGQGDNTLYGGRTVISSRIFTKPVGRREADAAKLELLSESIGPLGDTRGEVGDGGRLLASSESMDPLDI